MRCTLATMTTYDARVLSRIMMDLPVEGKVPGISAAIRPLAERLLWYPATERPAVLDGFSLGQPDPDRVVRAVVGVPPSAPEPGPEARPAGATLADVCRLDGDRSWPWPGWLPRGALTALASDPGRRQDAAGD